MTLLSSWLQKKSISTPRLHAYSMYKFCGHANKKSNNSISVSHELNQVITASPTQCAHAPPLYIYTEYAHKKSNFFFSVSHDCQQRSINFHEIALCFRKRAVWFFWCDIHLTSLRTCHDGHTHKSSKHHKHNVYTRTLPIHIAVCNRGIETLIFRESRTQSSHRNYFQHDVYMQPTYIYCRACNQEV